MTDSKTTLSNALNDHTTALVPVEAWAYQSPELRRQGRQIDMGLFAEALIYYERVLVVPESQAIFAKAFPPGQQRPRPQRKPAVPQSPPLSAFAEFVDWFAARDDLDSLIALLKGGELAIYHYAFQSMPIELNGVYDVVNAQDKDEAAGPVFMRRLFTDRGLERVVKKTRQREQLYRALENRVIERRAEEFGRAVNNAKVDYQSPPLAAAVVQAFVDDMRESIGGSAPAEIVATTSSVGDRTTITVNVNFEAISRALAPTMHFGAATPLVALVQSNRTLWSAAGESCDLYLPSPISAVASLKLAETNGRRTRTGETVEILQREVDFPDIRTLVNSGALSFADVLILRRKARRFRQWLQTQADRDTNALVAYHHEVAAESGLTKFTRKTLRAFGMLTGAAAGAYAAGAFVGPAAVTPSAAAGAAFGGKAVEESVKFLFDVAGRLDEDWKPVVFGNWARQYVQKASTSR
jgi:hypothetical protein